MIGKKNSKNSIIFISVISVFFYYEIAFGSNLSGVVKSPYYSVQSVKGKVLTRGSFDYSWSEIQESQQIAEGQILQTTEGSEVTLLYHPGISNDGSRGQIFTQKIDVPIVVRLMPGILRELSISRHFMQDLPAIAHQYGSLNGDSFEVKSGWNKVQALVADRKSFFRKEDKSGNEKINDGIQASVSAKKIKVFMPYNPQKVWVDKIPHEFLLRWQSIPIRNASYQIYVWPVSQPRPAPMGYTKGDQYRVSIVFPGKYFMQVTSQGDKWQSDVVTLELILDLAESQTKKGKISKLSSKKSPLRLLYPPPHLTMLMKKNTVKEFFRWNFDSNGEDPFYDWVLLDTKGKEIRRVRTVSPYTQQALNEGSYLWYVEAKERRSIPLRSSLLKVEEYPVNVPSQGASLDRFKVSPLKSEIRQISVFSQDAWNKQTYLEGMLTLDRQQSIYFIDGL